MKRTLLPYLLASLLLGLLSAGIAAADAAPATRPAPTIVIQPAVEEGHKVLHATVTIDGKPVRDAKVQFSVARTFGNLTLGDDATDDDGVAAVKFPQDLPGNARGELVVIATIISPQAHAGARQVQSIGGAIRVIPPNGPAFPRALWAPRAPLPLLASIFAAIGGVWLTYVFVIAQILAIRKGGRS